MLRGLYTAASGMITQQRKHDAITNNMANLNTPGYKQGQVISRAFPEMLISLINGGGEQAKVAIGRLNTGVFAEENVSIFTQENLQETNNLADIALVSAIEVPGLQFDASGKALTAEGEIVYQPQAFFTLLDDEGQERYTRNGQLALSPGGDLITTDGFRVLGADRQPIVLSRNLTDLVITANGQFMDKITGQAVVNEAGQPLALFISRIEDPYLLIREGNGNYRLTEDANAAGAVGVNDQVQIIQGFIEGSNVDPTQSTIDMMAAFRAYVANQKMVQYDDRSMEKAVNEVGRV